MVNYLVRTQVSLCTKGIFSDCSLLQFTTKEIKIIKKEAVLLRRPSITNQTAKNEKLLR